MLYRIACNISNINFSASIICAYKYIRCLSNKLKYKVVLIKTVLKYYTKIKAQKQDINRRVTKCY